ncbi:hypothetical protein OE88DRAFT_1658352 [Heliocybe sulcata]|uniref:Uncharacterized protein n=1 Tax=Heliocybe sulcata TaxID=5364 RepID=A0A5C3NDY7_9AGAM|nr:hypothetical protein OE88DRAFT_1658352 [Heliocybe sulcata]
MAQTDQHRRPLASETARTHQAHGWDEGRGGYGVQADRSPVKRGDRNLSFFGWHDMALRMGPETMRTDGAE